MENNRSRIQAWLEAAHPTNTGLNDAGNVFGRAASNQA